MQKTPIIDKDKWSELRIPLAHSYIINYIDGSPVEYIKSIFPNSEINTIHCELFGVNEAKELSVISSRISTVDSPQIFVISFEKITEQAQNTLLKVFEEPTSYTHFFLMVHKETHLLPTLISRCQVIRVHSERKVKKQSFIGLSFVDRMKIIDSLIEKGDIKDISIFLNHIESELHTMVQKNKITEKEIRFYKATVRTRNFLRLPSASIKQMLQYLASTA